jgi:hypothetical protein
VRTRFLYDGKETAISNIELYATTRVFVVKLPLVVTCSTPYVRAEPLHGWAPPAHVVLFTYLGIEGKKREH